MKQEEAKPITNGKAKPKSIKGIRIVSPGNGDGPFCGCGIKVIDLETGKEIENVREIHVRIIPDDIVQVEILMYGRALSEKFERVFADWPVTKGDPEKC